MKKSLFTIIALLTVSISSAQFSDDETMNRAIYSSEHSAIIEKNLFEGLYFGMSATQYSTVLDSLIRADKAIKKGDTYLIARNDTKTGQPCFFSPIPTFDKNKLIELAGNYLYEHDGIEALISKLEFESSGFKRYKYHRNGEDFYFLFRNNIMVSASLSEEKYIIYYKDNSRPK